MVGLVIFPRNCKLRVVIMRQWFKVRKERGWLNASYEAVRAGV
jgi:hypothetical protein